MNVHYFQHVPFEGLGYIETWLRQNGHQVTATKFYEDNYSIPPLQAIDALIIMGGPMSVYDEDQYKWLQQEKLFISSAIRTRRKILGICLGAQLAAACLGAGVKKAPHKEIGWYPVFPVAKTKRSSWRYDLFKSHPTVFHWHGDQFELPHGADDLCASAANTNQAFMCDDHVLGLQFHLEVTEALVKEMLAHGREELTGGAYIQDEKTILAGLQQTKEANVLMDEILKRFISPFT